MKIIKRNNLRYHIKEELYEEGMSTYILILQSDKIETEDNEVLFCSQIMNKQN